ncbi:MAG: class I SAM-dependent methyltransferase family protein, partial [Methanobrevibacter sp.]|nr:class I SAM-dependent methyltransferase family protein [Methanobrevibacter sp.]
AIDSLNEGGILHYHETVPEKLIDTRPLERIKSVAQNRDVELLKINRIKKYSPGVWHVVIDARIY